MRTKARNDEPTFRFTPRWKEELIVTGPGGAFILELPMGVLTACLPTEEAWPRKAPTWAHDLWPTLKVELEAWCAANRAALEISPTANVWPFHKSSFDPSSRLAGTASNWPHWLGRALLTLLALALIFGALAHLFPGR